MSANEKQVAGAHYGGTGVAYQHWDIVVEHKLNYFEGQITKYVMRCRGKNGKQDLEKAKHFIEKYLEVYDQMYPPISNSVDIKPYMKTVPGAIIEVPATHDFKVPFDFKEYFTEEGYRTDGSCLYTCLRCKEQFWGWEQDALNHMNSPHKRL